MRPVDTFYAALGVAIRNRRSELAFTQSDLAKRVGLKRTSITNIERGQQRLLADQLQAVALALKTDATRLLELASDVRVVTPRRMGKSSLRAMPDVAEFVHATLEGLRETSR